MATKFDEKRFVSGMQVGKEAYGVFQVGSTAEHAAGTTRPKYIETGFAPKEVTVALASSHSANHVLPGDKLVWNRAMYMEAKDSTYTGVRGSSNNPNDDFFCMLQSSLAYDQKISCQFPTSTQDAIGSSDWQASTAEAGVYISTTEERGFWIGGASFVTFATTSDIMNDVVWMAKG